MRNWLQAVDRGFQRCGYYAARVAFYVEWVWSYVQLLLWLIAAAAVLLFAGIAAWAWWTVFRALSSA